MMSVRSKGKLKTRSSTESPIFGPPRELLHNVLPTYEEIVQALLHRRYELIQEGVKNPLVNDIVTYVAEQVEKIWKKASIPTCHHYRIIARVKDYYQKYLTRLKPLKGRKGTESYEELLDQFKRNAMKLFDISSCKCVDFSKCQCEKGKKVPKREQEFLTDQRSTRKMIIGTVDETVTKKITAREVRIQNEKQRLSAQASQATVDPLFDYFENETDSENDSGGKPLPQKKTDVSTNNETKQASHQMRLKIPTVARECDRRGISDRAGAAICSAVLQDLGIIDNDDSSSVVDRSKIRREREKIRRQLSKQDSSPLELGVGLYFDGKKDLTCVMEKRGNKMYSTRVKEEHIVILTEPGSTYIGHVTPTTGKAVDIAESITSYLSSSSVDHEKVIAIGCDGTAVNTGAKGGIIRLLEQHFQRPLQWFICLLHANELPLRYLLTNLDGVTHGPKAFSGPIGTLLMKCNASVTDYEPIPSPKLPQMDLSQLSTDQKYMYEIYDAVTSGYCNEELANRHPGPVVHSRWLTTACRLMRLYIGTKNPSVNLVTLVEYVVRVYVPVWFAIKSKPSCSQGPRHLWKLCTSTRYLPDHLRDLVRKVISHNGFFAHSENILLAMLEDERPPIRELAVRRILLARSSFVLTSSVRQFRPPEINFEATDYTEMILGWHEETRLEPPVLRGIPEEELWHTIMKEMPAEGGGYRFHFSSFPCHTQAVERGIKLVTEAAALVHGQERRHGFIKAKIVSQKVMSSFDSKCEYHTG